MKKYHSGRFCPIIIGFCRHDCVSLNNDECDLIDSKNRIIDVLEEIQNSIQEQIKYNPAWDKPTDKDR